MKKLPNSQLTWNGYEYDCRLTMLLDKWMFDLADAKDEAELRLWAAGRADRLDMLQFYKGLIGRVLDISKGDIDKFWEVPDRHKPIVQEYWSLFMKELPEGPLQYDRLTLKSRFVSKAKIFLKKYRLR